MVDATVGLAAHDLDQLRRSCGEVITARRRDLRRGAPPLERDPRSAAGGHRPADDRRGGRHGGPLRARARPRDRGPVRRPQRGRARRRRTAGSSIDLSAMRGVEVDPRTRTARANGGALPRRARRRRPGARPRLPDRRRRPHRRRRADARWGSRPPPAPLRAHDRQPGRRRARHRRRPARPRDRDRGARALLGPPRRRLELRDRDGVRVPAPAVRAGPPSRRPDLPGDPGPGALGHLPRVRARARPMRCRRSSASTGPAPDAGYADDMVGKPIVYFAWNHSGAAEDVERDTAGAPRRARSR